METYLGRPLGVHTFQKVAVAAKRSLRNASGSPIYIWHVQSPPNVQSFDFKNIYRRGNFSENNCSKISFFGIPNTKKITSKIWSSWKKLFVQLMRKKVAVAVKKSLRNASGRPNYIRHVQPPQRTMIRLQKHFFCRIHFPGNALFEFLHFGPKNTQKALEIFWVHENNYFFNFCEKKWP